jgi:hypothetical protein
VFYGSFNPRRRAPSRRLNDTRFHSPDWHSPHLLAIAISISLLSMVDAFLTVVLLQGGAKEINPIMAVLIYKNIAIFAAMKMAMTGVSVVFMVVLARYRFMRLVRVEWALYAVLAAYVTLISYEFSMLEGPVDLPLL